MVAALLPLARSAAAQSAPEAAGSPAAIPAARIDSVFSDLDRTDSPGCAVGVVRDGALIYAEGYGSANLDHEIPITPETVFYMGSVSKQFTAGAVLLAARQGHLSLDNDIRTWVPEIPYYGRTITVRHLIHHTSGLRDYLTLQGLRGSYGGATDEQIIELLARQRALNFEPGDHYLYSNTGYFLLSEILERATGLTLREYAEREFFRPLGMRDSHFHDDADHIVRYRATGYAPTEDGFRMEHAWDFAQVGSGGLYSNVVDMARWDAAFEAGRVGDPGFTDAMLERGVLGSGDTLDYAFGLRVRDHRGLRTIGHGGTLAGFRSFMLQFPDNNAAVVVLCNVTTADPGGRAERVAEIVLGDALGDVETAQSAETPEAVRPGLAAEQLAGYAGRYYSQELDIEATVRTSEAGVILELPEGRTRRYAPAADDVFDAPASRSLEFRRGDDGAVRAFVLNTSRARGIVFERVWEGAQPGSDPDGTTGGQRPGR